MQSFRGLQVAISGQLVSESQPIGALSNDDTIYFLCLILLNGS